jgi:hypothetical protein
VHLAHGADSSCSVEAVPPLNHVLNHVLLGLDKLSSVVYDEPVFVRVPRTLRIVVTENETAGLNTAST